MKLTTSLVPLLLACTSTLASADPSHASASLLVDAETAASRAVSTSPLAEAATHRVDAARSALTTAEHLSRPEIAVTAAVSQHSSVPELRAAIGGPGTAPRLLFPDIQTRVQTAVELDQPVWTGGAITAQTEAARHGVEAAEQRLEQAFAALRLAGRNAYWDAVAASASVDAATSHLRRARQLETDVRSLHTAGMAVAADLLAAEARVRAAEAALVGARTDHAAALATLRSRIGLDPSDPLTLADAQRALSPPEPAKLTTLIAEALERRSEPAALAARRDALEAHQRLEGAALQPAIHAQAAWQLARPNQAILPLEDRWNDSWSVGLAARWTVFDSHRTRSRIAETRAEAAAVEAEMAETQRQIRLEVEVAHLQLTGARESITAAAAAEAAARARVTAERDRLEAGMATVADLLDADSELADAQLDLVTARAHAWRAHAALDFAVGR